MNTCDTTAKPRSTGRRAQSRMVRQYSPSALTPNTETSAGTAHRLADGSVYGTDGKGALVRLNKDRRSPKERKRARREEREVTA